MGVIEMGAQWIHGEKDNPVFSLASAAKEILPDIKTLEGSGHAENAVFAYAHNGKKISPIQIKEYKELIKTIYEMAKTELVNWDTSLGEYFVEKY
jgi:hypothetical protein